jgi:redox-sensitive bicupin YhaK (pirin superfamily)
VASSCSTVSIIRRLGRECEDGQVALFRRRQPVETTKVFGAADRFETVTDTITSWHCFSAGGHYDPQRIAFGPLTGVDEHLLAPGAGFDWHAHRSVEILSWVLEGTLRHEDDSGRVELLGPGEVLRQSTGSGIRHSERNASDTEPLRLVQVTLLGGTGTPSVSRTRPPLLVPGAGLFDVLTGKTELELSSAFLYVTRGSFNITGHALEPGYSVQIARTMQVSGGGELLVWAAGPHHDRSQN